MKGAEQVYRLMLRAYPRRFRESYEHEMMIFFRDQERNGETSGAGYWVSLANDLLHSAPREWRASVHGTYLNGGFTMKPIAALAILVGAYEAYGGTREATFGGFFNRAPLGQFGLSAAILASVLMCVAGIALLVRGRSAMKLARIAGIATICAFAFVGLTSPMLGIFSMLLGTVFPAAMLVYLFTSRSGDSARPTTA